jgi:hypothetical protein
MTMNRELCTLLAGTSGALLLPVLPMTLMATASKGVPPAPVARVEVARDTHFGETISDPLSLDGEQQGPRLAAVLEGPE